MKITTWWPQSWWYDLIIYAWYLEKLSVIVAWLFWDEELWFGGLGELTPVVSFSPDLRPILWSDIGGFQARLQWVSCLAIVIDWFLCDLWRIMLISPIWHLDLQFLYSTESSSSESTPAHCTSRLLHNVILISSLLPCWVCLCETIILPWMKNVNPLKFILPTLTLWSLCCQH